MKTDRAVGFAASWPARRLPDAGGTALREASEWACRQAVHAQQRANRADGAGPNGDPSTPLLIFNVPNLFRFGETSKAARFGDCGFINGPVTSMRHNLPLLKPLQPSPYTTPSLTEALQPTSQAFAITLKPAGTERIVPLPANSQPGGEPAQLQYLTVGARCVN